MDLPANPPAAQAGDGRDQDLVPGSSLSPEATSTAVAQYVLQDFQEAIQRLSRRLLATHSQRACGLPPRERRSTKRLTAGESSRGSAVDPEPRPTEIILAACSARPRSSS